ncbi:F420-non-reducing hydrogenase subunit A [Archaeoglobus sulfaticallidus PM70-1]|uniref:F420-non-reducing hydrogenase subunit A n=2 Tax=Archaeoglobus TaxID=2233 RepID=N0BFN5_9EURY|nr:F420-non-reducing hydrogenase subunit A [Archaeoglobus sulfaticallidus PM70-1]
MKVEINPMTRLEGHGKITIIMDENGNFADAYFQTVEFRGYEKFLAGLPIEEVPRTVSTICGVCRGVHHTAATKASDGVYGVEPTETAKKIRELFLNAHYVEDHAVILYALGLPDFVVGPEADPAERNLIGLVRRVGVDIAKEILKKRKCAVKIFELLGGKPIHPVAGLPGGWSKKIEENERQEIEKLAKELVELGQITLQIFEDVILKNEKYMELVTGDLYRTVLNYMGTVDDSERINYYDGVQKIVDTRGNEIGRFRGKEYLEYIAERVIPWSYMKFPYLKQLGWNDIRDGEGTSIYSVGPLPRLNVSEGMNTPLAQEHYEKMFEVLGEKPAHYILSFHWARAIELLNAAERVLELAQDESITNSDVRAELGEVTGEGVGILEAPRGTLIHHYKTDDRGIVEEANLIVATTHNNAAINLAIRNAAKKFVKNGEIDEKILNYVEMAFRPYDLCLACATHTLPGRMPIEIEVYDSEGMLYRRLRNF